MRITFLGAGSGFAPTLAKDIFQIPSLEKGEFCLVDVDKKRLDLSTKATEKMNEALGKKWTIIADTDRKKVLKGSKYLINCIEVSGVSTVKYDYEIPLKYGVDQCIGDTIGPGGIMKALRTVPAWVEILRDAERFCPDALVLNYTNSMSIMTLAGFRSSKMRLVGLCHSVQGSSKQLASYLGVPYPELKWKCAGINHMSWFTELRHKGQDMYPVLKKKVREDKALYEKDPVRFEIMLHFDYFVTESSGHFSEYVPYFRKRSELIDKYCREGYLGGRGFYAKSWPSWREQLDERRARIAEGKEKLSLSRSHEYASQIVESIEADKPSIINGNVLNTGLIENLPQDQVVEVPCLVDKNGITPTYFGELPPQLAALCGSNMAVFELAVKGILARDYQAVLHSLLLDPLTAAVCSPAEIKSMFDELLEKEKDYVPHLK
jgi:alpha-galactosidase